MSSKRFFAAPAWKEYNLTLSFPIPDNDNDLDALIRGSVVIAAHASGTAAMSYRGAGWGVVDPDLRVKKVSGLRVVDASIMVCARRSVFRLSRLILIDMVALWDVWIESSSRLCYSGEGISNDQGIMDVTCSSLRCAV